MAHRFLFAALGIIAALFALPEDACARGGGRAGAPGAGRAGPPVYRAGPRPSHFSAGRFLARHPVTWRHRTFGRVSSAAWPYGGLWWGGYGGFYDAPAEFFGPAADARIAAAIARLALVRPSCQLQTQTREVASEGGGTRTITVTRCVAPSGFPEFEASRNAAEAADDLESVTGSIPAEIAAPTANAARAPAARTCRVETRVVPSEAGGSRTITVRRC